MVRNYTKIKGFLFRTLKQTDQEIKGASYTKLFATMP